jgi:hypothetical protein
MQDRAHVAQGGEALAVLPVPTREQLGIAAAALAGTAARNACEREACATVAAWLERVAVPSRRQRAPDRCECGAALAHVADAGLEAMLCPRWDEELAEACDDGDATRRLRAGARGCGVLGAALAFCVALGACAQTHGGIDDARLYVHLCDAMPEDDQRAWGFAAGDINAELGEPVLWVGHGPPIGCNTVDVCPSSDVREGARSRRARFAA